MNTQESISAYGGIVAESIACIEDLPVQIPPEGYIAGFVHPQSRHSGPHNAGDNFHYPMGQSFYRLGVSGVARKAASGAADVSKSELQRALLAGIAKVYSALSAYFRRYGETVSAAALTAPEEGGEKSRLTAIAASLTSLAQDPPRTFAEAVQLFYIMWGLRNIGACSDIGRLDVHLRPFYEADLAAGRTTYVEAYRVVLELFSDLNKWGSGDTLMNVMLGGRGADGRDDSSDLTVMMLDAAAQLRGTEPHISLRWHRNIRPDVMEAAYRLQYLGYGQAAVYNDEVIIPAMLREGIPLGTACRYANDGCTEIVWDGLGRIDFNHIDAVATLELALNGGHMMTYDYAPVNYLAPGRGEIHHADAAEGHDSGRAEDCRTFDELYSLFMDQYRYQIRLRLDALKGLIQNNLSEPHLDLPFLSGTYDEILESGTAIRSEGLPMNSYMVFLGSIPTVADGLEALRRVVYEDGHYTVAQVRAGMNANYEGFGEMRAELLRAPKFGNDDDEVDLLSAKIVSDCCDYIAQYRRENGVRIYPALCGWVFVQEAYSTAAGADGRLRREPIAEHYCATPGKAVSGVTALVNSIAKADLSRALGVAPTHLSLSRSFVSEPEEGTALLRSLNLACLQKGLFEYDIAIYDAAVLREAQKHPEQHGDLIVRVWGFSARFVTLSAEMQDHIIARTLTRG